MNDGGPPEGDPSAPNQQASPTVRGPLVPGRAGVTDPILQRLDEWTEKTGASVMISRRLDLRLTPEEWSVILTCELDGDIAQYQGKGMAPWTAIEEALAAAETLTPSNKPW